ncbi:hypothetical protein PMAYCL1PPCAC_30161 [Pristionchus mayeri]|uniref:Uncharacterized protein n=1 Tax=Pristionchus mayeri TaxID=1317129 RepID=A0AAN5DBG0_9BILA|nr:hypothetical protein PMAYCL1PPCAC_30161 [Pristionchus mayeri]
MGASSTLVLLLLLGFSSIGSSFLFGNGACGCPPPPPPPRCDCACSQQTAPHYAPQPVYAPQSAYSSPAAVHPLSQQVSYASVRSSASEAYDAAIDNAVLDTLPGQGGVSSSTGYQGPARGVYAIGPHEQYPSTAAINGFPSARQSGYAQSSSVYGGQQTQRLLRIPSRSLDLRYPFLPHYSSEFFQFSDTYKKRMKMPKLHANYCTQNP